MNVYFSKTAAKKLEKLLDYLETEWSLKVKNNFISKLDNAVQTISIFPEAFPQSAIKKGYRKCVVTKHTSLYYRIGNNKIEVSTLFDNRQDPRKLNS